MDIRTRIETIRTVRDTLESYDYQDQSLYLQGYGYQPIDGYNDFSIQDSLVQGDDDEKLLQLASHLRGEEAKSDDAAAGPRPLSIFASHLNAHRELVAQYKQQFERYGISLFVAHDSITPDEEWANEIRRTLGTADCGLVFLHEGFRDSQWCDQEVGWLLGRQVAVPILIFGQHAPYGPMGMKQGLKVGTRPPHVIVPEVLDIYRRHSDLAPKLVESFIVGLERTGSFRTTDLIWEQIRDFRELTSEQVERVEAAVMTRDQIYNTGRGDEGTYPELFDRFLKAQANYSAPAPTPAVWDEAPF